MQLRELIMKLRRERDKLNYVIDSLEQLQGIMVETKMLRKRPGRKS